MLIPTIFSYYPLCRPVKGILHVGAHKCEEEPLYNSIGMYSDNVLWIEGNKDLINNNKKNMISAVISDKDGEKKSFIITNNMESSSILELHTHKTMYPHVIEIDRREVTTITLNTLFDNYKIPYNRYDFINLDIQGAELLALIGASKILPYIKAIYSEVNKEELYKDCARIEQIDDHLKTYGFKRIVTNMTEFGWGDALYYKV